MKRIPQSRAMPTVLELCVGLQSLLSQYWLVNLAGGQKKQWTQRNVIVSTLFQDFGWLLRLRWNFNSLPLLYTLTFINQNALHSNLLPNSKQTMIFQSGSSGNTLITFLITKWFSSWLGELSFRIIECDNKKHLSNHIVWHFPRGLEEVCRSRMDSRAWTAFSRYKSLFISVNLGEINPKSWYCRFPINLIHYISTFL